MISKHEQKFIFTLNTLCFLIILLSFFVSASKPAGFVTAQDTQLRLNGGSFYFSGANSFSMLYSEIEAKKQFELAQSLGLNVLRIWGFWNGEDLNPQLDEQGNVIRPGTPQTDIYGHYVLQSKPGEFPEQAWRRLDYVIYLANKHNIKLIIPLLNQWPEFGGLETYLKWVGIKTPEPTFGYSYENALKNLRAKFWVDKKAQTLYFDYVKQMLNRVNTYTNVAYKDDPAIMIWEIINEPRYGPWAKNKDATIVRDWLAAAADHIKSIDSNHLVGTGEEGFLRSEHTSIDRKTYPWNGAPGEGVDFVLNAQIENIDVLGFHCWPFQWGLWGSSEKDLGSDQLGEYPDLSDFAPEWIAEHVKIANEIGKPAYLGEFGFQILRQPGSDLKVRNEIMKKTYEAAIEVDLPGIAYWHMTAATDPSKAVYKGPINRKTLLQSVYTDDIKPHDVDFRFDIFCPADQSTCNIIKDYSEKITSKVENPDPPYQVPCLKPRSMCDDECIFLDSHPNHCGTCNNVCPLDKACFNGKCTPFRSIPQEEPNIQAVPSGCKNNYLVNLFSSLLTLLF